jgi:gluconate 2-dehydrogenase gamma chain
MNRRDLFRGAAWLPLSAVQVPAREIPADADASRDLARPDWRPVFLDAHQNDTLVAFADLLIPATATPGAKASDANRFIDLLLAAESTENQRAFLDALAFLDGESRQRYGAAFAHVSRERQMEFMHLLAYPRMVSVSPRSAFTPGDSTGTIISGC